MKDEFEQFLSKTENEMPDGLMDASSYVNKIESVVKAMATFIDHESDVSRMSFMMKLFSICSDSDEGLVAVLYILSLIITSLDDLSEGSYYSMISSFEDDIIPILKENQSSVPYWKN